MNDLLELIEERHCARVPFQDRANTEKDLQQIMGSGEEPCRRSRPLKAAFAVRLGRPVTAVPDPRVRREVA